MRVLFDDQIFSLQKHGGISRYFAELAKNLSLLDDVQISLGLRYSDNEYILDEKKWRVRRLWGGGNFPGKARVLLKMNKAYGLSKLKAESPDIYHPTYYVRPYSRVGSKLVVTIHDLIDEKLREVRNSATSHLLESRRNLCETANHIIVISESTKKDLLSAFPIPESKVSVVYHGSPEWDLVPRLSRMNLPDRFVLFVGKRDGYKNFDKGLHGLAPHLGSKMSTHLICAGGGAFSAVENKQVEVLGLAGFVHQFDVGDSELIELYDRAELLFFPSIYEGFGMPILEAFVRGCTVACSSSSSLPEVGGDLAQYFSPNDCEEISAVTGNLLNNPEWRKQLGEQGKSRSHLFTWQKCSAETKKIYDRVLIDGS